MNLFPRISCATLALALFVAGCSRPITGSGNEGSEDRSAASFVGVEVDDALEAMITVAPGQPQSIRVSGDDNLIGTVRTRVVGGKLVVDVADPPIGYDYDRKLPLVVTLSAPSLESLVAMGASDVHAHGVDTDSLIASTSGASSLIITGKARALRIEAEGASAVVADELAAASAEVHVVGASDAVVCATASLDATVRGASSVRYTCDPEKVTRHVEGASSVDEL